MKVCGPPSSSALSPRTGCLFTPFDRRESIAVPRVRAGGRVASASSFSRAPRWPRRPDIARVYGASRVRVVRARRAWSACEKPAKPWRASCGEMDEHAVGESGGQQHRATSTWIPERAGDRSARLRRGMPPSAISRHIAKGDDRDRRHLRFRVWLAEPRLWRDRLAGDDACDLRARWTGCANSLDDGEFERGSHSCGGHRSWVVFRRDR